MRITFWEIRGHSRILAPPLLVAIRAESVAAGAKNAYKNVSVCIQLALVLALPLKSSVLQWHW